MDNGFASVADKKAAAYRLMLERIEVMRRAVLQKVLEGDGWMVYSILKCNEQEIKLLDLLDGKEKEPIEIAWEEDEPTVWHTTGECAAILGVSPRTVLNAINSGILPAERTNGNHSRIKHEDLMRFKNGGALEIPENPENSENLEIQGIPKISGIPEKWETAECEPAPTRHFGVSFERSLEVVEPSINYMALNYPEEGTGSG
jgi:excisionase family DNA binding protein